MSQSEKANAGWPRCSDRAGNVERSAAAKAVVISVKVLKTNINFIPLITEKQIQSSI